MSYLCSYYHFVFRTKNSRPTISPENAQTLYKYIFGISENLGCRLLRINGMADHIHIAVELPNTLPQTYMREIKGSSSKWIKGHRDLFPNFEGWGREYFGSSFSHRDLHRVVGYISNQQYHHSAKSFEEEMVQFFNDSGKEDKIGYFLAN